MPNEPNGTSVEELLALARELALGYIAGLPDRAVATPVERAELLEALGAPLAEDPVNATNVIRDLAAGADRGLVATSGGRFFGFVEGGVLPAALAADWLTSTWDQNPGFYVLSPAAAVVEEVVAGWILDLLTLPPTASVGFTTGAQGANLTGLAAARHHVLAAAGWDVEADGLSGAPPVSILVGEERHATIGRALRFLGFGERTVTVVPADDQGAMDPKALESALAKAEGPIIVCAQAGNVNTGAFDPFRPICEASHDAGAWVHVDGAFGLWAAASPRLRHLVDGIELADSWAVDAHKWLNVPYDSAFVACAHPESHSVAMALSAPYLVRDANSSRNGSDWTPESSRRARSFAVWAALRSLGRSGVAEMIERNCDLATRFASKLAEHDEVEILNDVVLNQVLVRIGDDDARTRAAASGTQRGGAAWFGDTVWRERVALRISVSDQATTDEDVDRAVGEILTASSLNP
jgi:glutamate/tyrosine decarboxylase-like PLP-dependent enzyme